MGGRRRAERGWLLPRPPLLRGLVLALGLALVACSQPVPAGGPSPAAGSTTRTSEGGQVTVTVTWRGPTAGPVFAVILETHAVDLDGYDLRTLATLRTDGGREVVPSGWDAPKGGHHRAGTLTFPATATDGAPVIGADTRTVELVVRDIAGIPERRFQWPL